MNEPVPRDDDDRKVLSYIRSHGWHMVGVESDEEGPGSAYSVGLLRTFGHPEILVVGLDTPVLFGMINQIGELIRTGKRFEHYSGPKTVDHSGHLYLLTFFAPSTPLGFPAINLGWGPIVEGLVKALLIVEPEVRRQARF